MPANLPDTVIAVFEKLPFWGPELQRQFEHTPITVRECRTVASLRLATNGCSSALFVIDLDSALTDCLEWLGSEAANQSIRWPIVACGSTATAELEWLLREAGVTEFLPDATNGGDFARLCRRQLGLPQRGKAVR